MSHALQLVESETDGILTGQAWPLLPDGEYLAICAGWQTLYIFRSAKLFLHFRITEGPHAGARLFQAFAVQKLMGKPGKFGHFKVGLRSKLALQIIELQNACPRGDRISLRWMLNSLLRVSTRTVAQNSEQRHLPRILHYSIVERITKIEAGGLDRCG